MADVISFDRLFIIILSSACLTACMVVGAKFIEMTKEMNTPNWYIILALSVQFMLLGLGFKYFLECFKEYK